MNLPTKKEDFFLRQRALQLQLFEALNVGDENLVSLLNAQWVHRYGLETLPDQNKINKLFVKENPKSLNKKENIEEEKIIYETEKPNPRKKSEIIEEIKSDQSLYTTSKPSKIESVKAEEDLKSKIIKELSQAENQNNSLSVNEFKQLNVDKLPNEMNLEDNLSAEQFDESSELENESSLKITPPPPPSLNKLRRWIPND